MRARSSWSHLTQACFYSNPCGVREGGEGEGGLICPHADGSQGGGGETETFPEGIMREKNMLVDNLYIIKTK